MWGLLLSGAPPRGADRTMPQVYVSIGSNIDREQHIRAALAALRNQFSALSVSTVYQTRAVGFESDDFYNLVAGFATEHDVHSVVRALRAVEAAQGRRRDADKFAARTLDIDLLLYDDLIINEPGLKLPRAEMTRFAFVLGPLAEIAGARVHPTLGKSFATLWAAFAGDKTDLRPVQLADS